VTDGSSATLDHAAKAMELEDIEARLAELEQAADPSKSENLV
jgi:hypothetical protein